MEKIPFHQRFIKSINDPAFVAASIKEKTASVLLYTLIVLIIFAGFSGAVKGIYFNNYIKDVLAIVNTPDFPDFQLGDGEFYIDGNEPIIIEEEDFIFAIDTSGQTTINDIISYNTGYLLTDKTLIISLAGQSNYIDLDTISWYQVSRDELIDSLELTSNIGVILYIVGSIISSFFSIGLRSLILLFIANILRRMLQLDGLKGSMLFNIVLYSITIGIVLYQLFSILPSIFPVTLIGELFFTAGSVLFFYIPSSTVLSRTLKYLRLHEELSKLQKAVDEHNRDKGKKPQVYENLKSGEEREKEAPSTDSDLDSTKEMCSKDEDNEDSKDSDNNPEN